MRSSRISICVGPGMPPSSIFITYERFCVHICHHYGMQEGCKAVARECAFVYAYIHIYVHATYTNAYIHRAIQWQEEVACAIHRIRKYKTLVIGMLMQTTQIRQMGSKLMSIHAHSERGLHTYEQYVLCIHYTDVPCLQATATKMTEPKMAHTLTVTHACKSST